MPDRFSDPNIRILSNMMKDIIIFILCEEYDLLYIAFGLCSVRLLCPEKSGVGLGITLAWSDVIPDVGSE